MPKGEGKLIAQNRKARHDYSIIDTVEAGLVLQGTEIKSIRNGRINLKDGFARIRNGEAFCIMFILVHMNKAIFLIMTHYVPENYYYTKQINKLIGETKNTGITLVPLKVYIKDGYAKVLIGLAKGKKQYDKREDLKRKEVDDKSAEH